MNLFLIGLTNGKKLIYVMYPLVILTFSWSRPCHAAPVLNKEEAP